jgi:hypothetical protein
MYQISRSIDIVNYDNLINKFETLFNKKKEEVIKVEEQKYEQE